MKMKGGEVQESWCRLQQIPNGHECAVWLEPVVCTIEYMPSEKDGYRQPVFKGFREDKCPEECRM